MMASQGGASTTLEANDASQSQSPSLPQHTKKHYLSDSNIDNSTTKKAKGEQNDGPDKLMLKTRRLLSNGKTGGKEW